MTYCLEVRRLFTSAISPSVIVHDFNVIGVAIFPDKADSPLIVDANAVLPGPVTGKSFQTVSSRYAQVVQARSAVQDHQLSLRPTLNVPGELADMPPLGNRLGVFVPETPYHSE